MKNHTENIFNILVLLVIGIVLSGCSIKMGDIYPTIKKASITSNQTSPVNSQKSAENADDNEKTVVVSVNNFGRGNPFQPYQEKSLMLNQLSDISASLPTIDISRPPEYEPDSDLSKLLKIKVGGILYDPRGSSAIINVDDSDYFVHKGDTIFGFYVANISPDKVSIKYNNNIYKAGIGEIFDGGVNTDPVSGKNKKFAGSQKYNLPPVVKKSQLSYLPSLKISKNY